MSNKRLFVDMDGTLARFHDEVNYLECMYEKGFFENLLPFENTVEALRIFIREHPDIDVLACSAAVDSPYCCEEKNRWLDRYLPEIPADKRLYTSVGQSKAEVLPGGVSKGDYLLDDYNRGLYQFMHSGGSAIKCHNNINQKGTGIYGGARGFMWEGPMVHTDNSPALIASELSQLMGLTHDLDKMEQVSLENNVNYVVAPKNARQRFYEEACDRHLIEVLDGDRSYCFVAAQKDGETEDVSTNIFQNPFNALRFLSGDQEALEYRLKTHEGEELSLSGYQLQAICQNTYGNLDYHRYLHADRKQLADDARKALAARQEPVVGFVCRVLAEDYECDLKAFHTHQDMLDYISALDRAGEMYRSEWFVPCSERERTWNQNHPIGNGSLAQILKDAKNRTTQDAPAPVKKDLATHDV